MRKFFLTGLLISTTILVFGQQVDKIINSKDVERIISVLAADDMQGRKTFTPGIEKAAAFIAEEFKKSGVQTFEKGSTYFQSFTMVKTQPVKTVAKIDDTLAESKNIMLISCLSELEINEHSGFEVRKINAADNLFNTASALVNEKKNMLVFVDESFANNFSRLSFLKRNIFKTDNSVVFVLGSSVPVKYSFEFTQDVTEQSLSNMVAVLPGKSKKDEYVIFSAHYDHIGIGKPLDGDSIYNGANDDAAGTTAMMMLAKYFKALNNNERTIIFVAFTAEEIGGFGSQYFSRQLNPEKVVAMFNIEMIGTDSKWGKNSAFITGYEKTDMGAILEKNLEGSAFKFYPDPYPQQQLFYRSDNATLARLGVPAHTISTSKMDNEPNYHKASDEVKTLDLENMTEIIKAIALSSKSIISGKDTPSRVKTEDLR
jgi:Zn-dependent M28 family amino/carboxypeptidase